MMSKNRLEAFSDGIIAIIITIMVLSMVPPKGSSWQDLATLGVPFLSYLMSYLMVGTYWCNHHHLFQAMHHANGRILWANLLFLFLLSLFPISTGWISETHFARIPTLIYALLNLFVSLSYMLLQRVLLQSHNCVYLKKLYDESNKESATLLLEIIAVVFALVDATRGITYIALILMTLLWIVPDLRIVKALNAAQRNTADADDEDAEDEDSSDEDTDELTGDDDDEYIES